MALTEPQRTDAMRQLVKKMFVDLGDTATLNTDEVKAAIDSIDDFFAALGSTLTGGITVEQNLLNALPEPFVSVATNAQKSLALAYWAMKRGSVI